MMASNRLEGLLEGQRGLWLGLALFTSLAALSWVGFIASDDATYIHGAYGWLEQFPFVGGHGTIRYPITIPIALSFLAFGENEYTATLPSMLYLLAFLVLSWRAVAQRAGPVPAFAALLAVATCPLIVIQSTIASVDVIEMALLLGSFLLFLHCLENGPRPARLASAGALAGIAFLVRETAIFIVPFFAVLFLIGHRMRRLDYLWIPAGFLAVWLCELAYLGLMTGDPFYRINISLNHDSSIDRSVDLAGNLILHPFVDPLLVLLLNQEFMLLMYLSVPLGAWLCFSRTIDARLRYFAGLLALFGLSWFLCVGAAQNLLPLNPRYFMITSTVASLLAGIGAGQLLRTPKIQSQISGAALLVVLIGANFIGIYVENKQPIFGERQLAMLLEQNPQLQLVTDPMTHYRAEHLLRWTGTLSRISSAPPAPGALYYYNPARSAQTNAKMSESVRFAYLPQESWHVLAHYSPRPDLLMQLLDGSVVASMVPKPIWTKLRYRHAPVTLYRVEVPR